MYLLLTFTAMHIDTNAGSFVRLFLLVINNASVLAALLHDYVHSSK